MINGLHYITVATDASVKLNRSGMAYYLRDDNGTLKHAWYIEGKYQSHEAEWFALKAAIEVITNRHPNPNNVKIIFYCDNMTMIRLLENHVKSKQWKTKQQWLHEKLKGFSLEARHVPSHTNKTELKRYYLNRWCDFNARSMVRHGRLHEPSK